MVSIRTLGVLMTMALTGALVLAGCRNGADATCKDICDKSESCGDIDLVRAEQCRKQCDANTDTVQAEPAACINKSDILSAIYQCLDRACSDYARCLTAVPRCKSASRRVEAAEHQ